MSLLELPPLSIYVHMPWCVRKCPYCDFNSHAAPESLPLNLYVEGLLADLRFDLPKVQGRIVQTIFFGGGTPSLFPPEHIARFLDALRSCVQLAADVEITLEANPGTIEHGRFQDYRGAGVTRVSLGVQSFNDHQLKVLGRIHGRNQIFDAVSELRSAGIESFNLDLMYGLPEQSLAEALEDVAQALALEPPHLSHYQLTLEPGTAFYHRPPPLPDDDATLEMQTECQARLAAAGYAQYEVSAYARPGFACRHNLNYWQFGDYLGLGAGAHGKWTDAREATVLRTERCRQPREYLSKDAASRLVTSSTVAREELPFEFMLNALRLNEGLSSELFESRTGIAMTTIEATLAIAVERGLLESHQERWRATSLGQRFLNDLQGLFLSDSRSSSKTESSRASV